MKATFRAFAVAGIISGSALHAGTFSDVPSNHWAYAAVEKVANSGIIKGYSEKFHGDEKLSRYEIAIIISRLLDSVSKNGVKMAPEVDSTMKRLVDEFSNELALLGARVDALEARTANNERRISKLETSTPAGGNGNIKIDGNIGMRLQSHFDDGFSDNDAVDFQTRIEVALSGQVNEKTKWKLGLRTGSDDFPASSWKNIGSNDDSAGNFRSGMGLGTDELLIDQFYFDHKVNDEFRMLIGKGANLFQNTQMIFDNDFHPFGLTQEYKFREGWTFRAGQYYLKEGNTPTGAMAQEEDVYMFAHQLEYKKKNSMNGDWKFRFSHINFSGEQYLHPTALGGGVTNGRFVHLNPFTTNFAGGYGNLYNRIAPGTAPAFPGVTTNTIYPINAARQNRLFSDFELYNLYVDYKNTEDKENPWGVKADYVVNDGAWSEDDTGMWIEIWKGRSGKKGDIKYGYSYIDIEADAVMASLNYEMLGSNINGHQVFYNTNLADDLVWFTTYLLYEPNNDFGAVNVDKEGLLRTGVTWSF